MECRIRAWSLTTTVLYLEEEAGFVPAKNWASSKSLHSFTILLQDIGKLHYSNNGNSSLYEIMKLVNSSAYV